MKVLVTGAAGFIGSHVCERLLLDGHDVVGLDSFDDFYDPAVKRGNLAACGRHGRFRLVEADVRDAARIVALLAGDSPPAAVVHLAARAGVRPSIEQPLLYAQVNVDGTLAMLEACRSLGVRNFVFGSSSSVYGNNEKVPFAESDPVDRPISPYAATKRAGELLCHTYHHLYGLSVACLRFFTVYGPRQRPDLAIHKFARLMLDGAPVPMFGDGTMERDFTYIEDIVGGVAGALEFVTAHPRTYEVVNLGGNQTTSVRKLISLIGAALGVEPEVRTLPRQPGDVERTYADVRRAGELFGYRPTTPIEVGISLFAGWLRQQREAGAQRGESERLGVR